MDENGAIENIKTHIGERDLVIERIFAAPRKLVWRVFTEPEHLKHWWAPSGSTLSYCTIDLRPGGIWFYCIRSPEGDEQWVKSVYYEIVEPERITYNTTFVDAQANPNYDLPEQQSTALLSEQGGKTMFTAHVHLKSSADLQKVIDLGMIRGTAICWNALADYLKQLQ